MEKKYKPGDIVEIVLGSFPMMVHSVDGDIVTVIWSDYKTSKFHEKKFRKEQLKRSTKKDDSGPPEQIDGMIIN